MRESVAFRTDTCAKCARLITRGSRIVLAYGKTFHADCTQVAQGAPRGMKDQTLRQANDYVTAAEALADAVREYLAGMGGQAQLSDALDAFYEAKHTASRSLSESGASRAGTASGSDQAAADMGSDG